MQSIHSSMDPYFEDMIRACANWKPQILNYFDERVTNGYTESMNAVIREVDSQGRGYSFEVMRARILYDDEVRSKKTLTRGRRPKPTNEGMYGFVSLQGLGREPTPSRRTVEYGADLGRLAAMLARKPFRGDDSPRTPEIHVPPEDQGQ